MGGSTRVCSKASLHAGSRIPIYRGAHASGQSPPVRGRSAVIEKTPILKISRLDVPPAIPLAESMSSKRWIVRTCTVLAMVPEQTPTAIWDQNSPANHNSSARHSHGSVVDECRHDAHKERRIAGPRVDPARAFVVHRRPAQLPVHDAACFIQP